MRIEFSQEGGIGYFPGLNRPVTVDAERLDEAEAEELKRLVEVARFFDLPASIGVPARGAADYQRYILSIEDDGRRHTVRALVPVEDSALRELVEAVRRHVAATRTRKPGG